MSVVLCGFSAIIYILSVTNAHLININHPQCLSQRPLFRLNFQLKDEDDRMRMLRSPRKSLVSPENFQGNQNIMFKDTQTTSTLKIVESSLIELEIAVNFPFSRLPSRRSAEILASFDVL